MLPTRYWAIALLTEDTLFDAELIECIQSSRNCLVMFGTARDVEDHVVLPVQTAFLRQQCEGLRGWPLESQSQHRPHSKHIRSVKTQR